MQGFAQVGAHVAETAPPASPLARENERLRRELAALRLRVDELERVADSDPLVDIHNRRAFVREIGRAQTVSERYHIPSTVVFFDLNDFKAVNDRFGHAVGDEMLRAIGECLKAGTRACDLVARLGGDEFAVLLFKTPMDVARAKAEALQVRIQGCRIRMPTDTVGTDAAWGLAPCEPGVEPEAVLARADRAMYEGKLNEGKPG